MKTKKDMYAKHPRVDAELDDFIASAWSPGLPVTPELMQERAMTAAISKGITKFKASNG